MNDATETLEILPSESASLATEGTDPAQQNETLPESSSETFQETSVDNTESEYFLETEATTGSVIFETESTAVIEEVTVIEVIESVGSDIAHANLFSGFLVCGTLVGIALLRKIYGT